MKYSGSKSEWTIITVSNKFKRTAESALNACNHWSVNHVQINK